MFHRSEELSIHVQFDVFAAKATTKIQIYNQVVLRATEGVLPGYRRKGYVQITAGGN
jgi:hypothetical protein